MLNQQRSKIHFYSMVLPVRQLCPKHLVIISNNKMNSLFVILQRAAFSGFPISISFTVLSKFYFWYRNCFYYINFQFQGLVTHVTNLPATRISIPLPLTYCCWFVLINLTNEDSYTIVLIPA